MKQHSHISFIYFDLGGVVIDNEHTKQGLARDFNLKIDEIQQFFDEQWREACLGVTDNQTYLARFKDRFQVEHPKVDFVDFISEYMGHYQETHDLIHDLARDYRLGILSNAELGMIDTLFTKGKIPKIDWDVIIESAKVRTVKPEKKIYDIARKKAKVKPHEILFIDDRQNNIDAALALGWNTVLFDYFDVPSSIRGVKKALARL